MNSKKGSWWFLGAALLILILAATATLTMTDYSLKSVVSEGTKELRVLATDVALNPEAEEVVISYDALASYSEKNRGMAYAVHVRINDEWKSSEVRTLNDGNSLTTSFSIPYSDLGSGLQKIEFFKKISVTHPADKSEQDCYQKGNTASASIDDFTYKWTSDWYGKNGVDCVAYKNHLLVDDELDAFAYFEGSKTHRMVLEEKINSLNHGYDAYFVQVPKNTIVDDLEVVTGANSWWPKIKAFWKAIFG